MTQGYCLLCYHNCDGSNLNEPIGKSRIVGNSVLDEQVSVIFILRKLLDIPGSFCQGLLSHNGNPSNWINCCNSCSQLISDAHRVFKKITLLQKEFEGLKSQVGLVLDTSKDVQSSVVPTLNTPTDEIRKFALGTIGSRGISLPSASFNSVAHQDSEVAKLEAEFFVVGGADEEIEAESCFPHLHSNEEKSDEKEDEGVVDENVGESTLTLNQVEDSIVGKLESEFFEGDGEIMEQESCFPHLNSDDKSDEKNDDGIVDGSFDSQSKNDEGDGRFTCSQCPKSYTTLQNLQLHVIAHHTQDFPLHCPICGKGEVNQVGLNRHMRSHSESRMFACEVCGVAYKNENTLKNHQRGKHYEELNLKPLECELCGKTFGRRTELTIHMSSHTKDYRFPCSHCDRKFLMKRDFEDHFRRYHTGEKPFACHICGEAFFTSRLLMYHDQIHTGFRYTCEICGQGSVNKSKWERHMKKHSRMPETDPLLLPQPEPKRKKKTKIKKEPH